MLVIVRARVQVRVRVCGTVSVAAARIRVILVSNYTFGAASSDDFRARKDDAGEVRVRFQLLLG